MIHPFLYWRRHFLDFVLCRNGFSSHRTWQVQTSRDRFVRPNLLECVWTHDGSNPRVRVGKVQPCRDVFTQGFTVQSTVTHKRLRHIPTCNHTSYCPLFMVSWNDRCINARTLADSELIRTNPKHCSSEETSTSKQIGMWKVRKLKCLSGIIYQTGLSLANNPLYCIFSQQLS